MEGVNMGAFALGFLAIIVFGVGTLPALVLLLFRRTRAARVVFAVGFAAMALLSALAALTFLEEQFRRDINVTMILAIASTLVLAGTGQLVAALRRRSLYAASLGCAVVAVAIVTGVPLLGADLLGMGHSLVGQEVPITVFCVLLGQVSLILALLSGHAPLPNP